MLKNDIDKEVEVRTGINVFTCYQCGKCSAGCVFAQFMDAPPHLLMRYLQLNLKEKIFSSNTVWRCGACITCSVRCPRKIDVLAVINTVRTLITEEKIFPHEEDVHLFDEIFLDNIAKNDRLHEFGAVFDFNLKSGKYFKDISLFPILIEKGKLSSKSEKGRTQKIADVINKIRD